MDVKESFIENIIEKDNFKVDKVLVDSYWSEPSEMFKLSIKINGKWIFIVRREYDFYVKDLIKLGQEHNMNKGYFCHYGKGNPLDEINDKLEHFSYIENSFDNVYKFGGNHVEYSGVFNYYIWDKNIIKTIEEKLPILLEKRSKINSL